MTSTEIKQVVQALQHSLTKDIKITQENPKEKIYKITLPFRDRNGNSFYIWVFRYPKNRKLQLSDSRAMTAQIKDVGVLQLEVLQVLINSYGLSLMEDLSIMEISNRPLIQRVTSFLQCLAGLDSMLRTWSQMKEK
jgi:hypothetical protein